MKQELESLVRGLPLPAARNRIRERLQAGILGALQRAGAMVPLAFQGGTALRFLYGIRRFSEDLDFALERPERGYDFRRLLESVERELVKGGATVDVKLSDRKTVHAAFVTFRGLLAELGLSPHRSEALSIKIEVDTRPPGGAVLSTTVVRRYELLNLQHHDPASLLAGKLHAVLQRPAPKGRDFFDLLWYLSDPRWPAPNLILLNNALAQTGAPPVRATTWRKAVRARLASLDWRRVVSDVRPFLEDEDLGPLLTADALTELLRDGRLSDRS